MFRLSVLLVSLAQVPPPVDTLPSAVTAVCTEFPAFLTAAKAARREDELVGKLRKEPTKPWWVELGCLRARLAVSAGKAPKEKENIAFISGGSWYDAAIAAFLGAVEIEQQQDLELPIIALTNTALGRLNPPQWEFIDRAAGVVFAAAQRGDRRAEIVEACPRFLLAVADSAAAVECFRISGAMLKLPVVRALTSPITITRNSYRFWNDITREPMMLLTWSMLHEGKDSRELPKGGIGTSLVGWNLAKQEWVMSVAGPEFGWQRQTLKIPSVRVGVARDIYGNSGIWGVGVHAFLLPPGGVSWSLLVNTNVPGMRGRMSAYRVMPRDSSTLYLSDVLLTASQGSGLAGLTTGTRQSVPTRFHVRLPIGTDTLEGFASSTFEQGSELGFFFQLGSALVRDSAATTVNLYSLDRDSLSSPSLSLTFRSPVAGGINNIRKTIDLKALKPGRYRFEVVFTDQRSHETVRESAVLTVER